MSYTIHPKRFLGIVTFVGSLGWLILSGAFDQSQLMKAVAIGVVLTLAVLIALLRFSLEIHPDLLIYRIAFRKRTILEKEMRPEEIARIKFFRAGMSEKAAVIKRKDGWNIRLVVFKSHHPYDLLQAFAEVHELNVEMTKKYLLIEEWGRF